MFSIFCVRCISLCACCELTPDCSPDGVQGLFVDATSEERQACHLLTSEASSVTKLGWLLRMHAETVTARGALARAEARFADTACQELRLCPRWVDAQESRRKEVEQRVEAVFS